MSLQSICQLEALELLLINFVSCLQQYSQNCQLRNYFNSQMGLLLKMMSSKVNRQLQKLFMRMTNSLRMRIQIAYFKRILCSLLKIPRPKLFVYQLMTRHQKGQDYVTLNYQCDLLSLSLQFMLTASKSDQTRAKDPHYCSCLKVNFNLPNRLFAFQIAYASDLYQLHCVMTT